MATEKFPPNPNGAPPTYEENGNGLPESSEEFRKQYQQQYSNNENYDRKMQEMQLQKAKIEHELAMQQAQQQENAARREAEGFTGVYETKTVSRADAEKKYPPSKQDQEDAQSFGDWYTTYQEKVKQASEKKKNPSKKKGKDKHKYGSKSYGGATKSTRDKMANKFLPFIVESSTPHNIFKTLLSRSKGMNRALTASIFNLTLNVDIKELRKIANDLDEMNLDQLYEELLQRYDIYRINTDMLNHFSNIPTYFPSPNDNWWDKAKLKEFNNKDVMMFMCVYSINEEVGEYSDIKWKDLWSYTKILENFKSHINLSDDGFKMTFKGLHDLQTFILYRAVLHEQMEPDTQKLPINASYVK